MSYQPNQIRRDPFGRTSDPALMALLRRSIIREDFPAFPDWWPLGFLTPQHTIYGNFFYPTALDRAVMSGGWELAPHFYIPTANPPGNPADGTVTLAAFDACDLVFTCYEDTSLVLATISQNYTLGEGSPAPQSASQIDIYLGTAPDGSDQEKWNRGPVNSENIVGVGSNPYVFKPPVFTPAGQPIMVRITNALPVANQIQLCITGLGRVIR